MTEQALRKMIAAGESTRQEFKSWVKCKAVSYTHLVLVKATLYFRSWSLIRATLGI